MNVIVVGGGPAGMMAAISSANNGNNVIILEKMNQLGRKLLITGKGRCNITSSLPMDEFIKNTPGNGQFLYSCFKNFSNEDIIDFLKENGLNVKEERGSRIFPVTDKSMDVLNCFIKALKRLNVDIRCGQCVKEVKKVNDRFEIKTQKDLFYADKVIIATGGKSYPLTGSTGDGYIIANKLGHSITEIKPSLVPLECYDKEQCKQLQGLSLKNVGIEFWDLDKNKKIYDDFGEMIFTHFGISGPVILSGSAHLVRYKNIDELIKNKKIVIKIDLKPALTVEKLNERVLKDFDLFKNKSYKNSLDKLLPKKMIPVIIKKSNIDPEKKVNEITKNERMNLVNTLKEFELQISGFRSIDEAIITSGGINVKEINPKTMESKIIEGLFFAGEIIDVDSYTGGFNLQIAYSTGYTAGL